MVRLNNDCNNTSGHMYIYIALHLYYRLVAEIIRDRYIRQAIREKYHVCYVLYHPGNATHLNIPIFYHQHSLANIVSCAKVCVNLFLHLHISHGEGQ